MKPYCSAVCIGSFPHQQPEAITEKLIDTICDYPLWPQLPNRTFLESMYVQYSEGMPLVKMDLNERKIVFAAAENNEEEVQSFYEDVIAENYGRFSMSEEYAAGLYEFRRLADKISANKPHAVKGHITGPVSFALTVTDEQRRALYFNDSLKEIITAALKMKAVWQINFLKEIYSDVIFFVDEPYLSGIGSGIMSIDPATIQSELTDFIDSVKQIHPSVPLAFHCCGNTDWSLLINAGVDILSFDAFNYGESLFYYEDSVRTFLQRGGSLAWGIVPTSGDFMKENKKSLVRKMDDFIALMEKKGFNPMNVLENSFITPACGTGSLTMEEAGHILDLTSSVSSHLKSQLKS